MPSKKKYVFAVVNTTIMAPSRHRLVVGDVYYADSPPVQRYPDMFSEDPPNIHPRGWESPEVEQATAAPGEKRTTKRTTRDAS